MEFQNFEDLSEGAMYAKSLSQREYFGFIIHCQCLNTSLSCKYYEYLSELIKYFDTSLISLLGDHMLSFISQNGRMSIIFPQIYQQYQNKPLKAKKRRKICDGEDVTDELVLMFPIFNGSLFAKEQLVALHANQEEYKLYLEKKNSYNCIFCGGDENILDASVGAIFLNEKEKTCYTFATISPELPNLRKLHYFRKNVKFLYPEEYSDYEEDFKLFFNSGDRLAHLQFFPLQRIIIKTINQCYEYYLIDKENTEKGITSKIALPSEFLNLSNKLIRGRIDKFMSKSTKYAQSLEDRRDIETQENFAHRIFNGFTPPQTRYIYLTQITKIEKAQLIITFMKLSTCNWRSLSNRTYFKSDSGFISIGEITETATVGQRFGINLETRWHNQENINITDIIQYIKDKYDRPQETDNFWYICVLTDQGFQFIKLASPFFSCKGDTIIFIDTIQKHFDCIVDFSVISFQSKMCFLNLPTFIPSTRLIGTRFRISPLTLYGIEYLKPPQWPLLNFFSMVEYMSPAITSHHLAKTFQGISSIKNGVFVKKRSGVDTETIPTKQIYEDICLKNKPLGCPIGTAPWVRGNATFSILPEITEDGVGVSETLCKNHPTSNIIECNVSFKVEVKNLSIDLRPHMSTDEWFSEGSDLNKNIEIFTLHTNAPILFDKAKNLSVVPIDGSISNKASSYLWHICLRRKFRITNRKFRIIKWDHSITNKYLLVNIFVEYINDLEFGDKLSTVGGQKSTINYIFNDDKVDIILSAVSLKRVNLGEIFYGFFNRVFEYSKRHNLSKRRFFACTLYTFFSHFWLFADPSDREHFLFSIFEELKKHNLSYSIFTSYSFLLKQSAEFVSTYCSEENTMGVEDGFVGYYIKGRNGSGCMVLSSSNFVALAAEGVTNFIPSLRRNSFQTKPVNILMGVLAEAGVYIKKG